MTTRNKSICALFLITLFAGAIQSAEGQASTAPVVIFKMDDLRASSTASGFSAEWDRLFDYSAAKPLVMSVGIIGDSLETTHADYAANINQIHSSGLIEFWNHGYLHVRDQPTGTHEFDGTGYEYQLGNFELTQMLAREKLGFRFSTFGAPYNQTDTDTLQVLATDPDMQTTFFVPSTSSRLFNLERWLNIESSAGVILDYETFVANYELQRDRPYLVLQGHPNNWDATEFETFERIIDYLIADGVTFMTPSGYRASLAADGYGVVVTHDFMDQRLGYPAIIEPGSAFPRVTVSWPNAGTLEASLVRTEPESVLQTLAPQTLVPGSSAAVTFEGDLPTEGVYRIDLRILEGASIVYRRAYSFSVLDTAALPSNYSVVAHPGPYGVMRYIPDMHGNRIPDYSGVGYLGGADIPDVPTVHTVGPVAGDATAHLQAAIDYVSGLAPDTNGFRGALELEAGLYEIASSLYIEQSGVVLRGAGAGPRETFMLNPADNLTFAQWTNTMAGTTQTILVATGPDYRSILTIAGASDISLEPETATEILDTYVPVGQRWFHVANPDYYAVGDTIQLERRGNADWISYIKMDQIPPRPDEEPIVQWTPFDLQFEYIITAIDGNRITVDSGIINAVEQRWGGGRILRYSEGGRIRQSGVEDLRAVSFWQINADGKDDTAHADRFVLFDRVRDSWARNVAAEHFTPNTLGMFYTGRASLAITIENCSALAAASSFYSGTGYDSSGRYYLATGTYVGRYGFLFTGQNGLVRNSYTINSRHAFTVSSRVPGPNVFSDCTGVQGLTYSEPHHRWSVGGLYDNVSDREFSLMNRLRYGSGHGWAGANYVAWNTEGGLICEQPPTAQNWAIGHVGTKGNGPFHSWNLDNYGLSYGYWESHGQHVTPSSLYTQQIADNQLREQGLLVSAGDDVTVAPTEAHPLSGSVYTLGSGPVSQQWSQVSGPAATFADASALDTTVSLSEEGGYVLRLTAWFGDQTRFDDVRIDVRVPVNVGVTTVDDIVGASDTGGPPIGYNQGTGSGYIGVGGSTTDNSRNCRVSIIGFALPDLPQGHVINSVTIHYAITASRSHSGEDFDAHVYLMDSADPSTTDTLFYYHGSSDTRADVSFVGQTDIPHTPGDTDGGPHDPPLDGSHTLVGDALSLFKGFYQGETPGQTEAFFRFNRSNPTAAALNSIDRFVIDVTPENLSLEITTVVERSDDYQSWLNAHFSDLDIDDSTMASNGVHTIRQTYIAGLNPTNASARFVIQDLDVFAGERVLQWPGVTGRLYSVYWSSNLLHGTEFERIGSNIAWNVGSYTDTVHRASLNSFYRIGVQLED